MTMKEAFLSAHGYAEEGWEVDIEGRLRCPHGYICEEDQRAGLGECGCVSPMVQENMI